MTLIELNSYFPERFTNNRSYFQKILRQFSNANFDIGDTYHKLRESIRQPINEWHEGAYLADELLNERDYILSILNKDFPLISDNATKEEIEKFVEKQQEKMTTPIWQQWVNWQKKTKNLIKTHPRLEEETLISKELIAFYRAGRNIFRIDSYLVNLLKRTDVGNIKIGDIKLPYDSIFFSFQPISDIQYPIECFENKHDIHNKLQNLEKQFHLDGAFVTMENDYIIDVTLTFVDTKERFIEKVSMIKDYRFPVVQFSLDFGKWDMEKGTTHSSETTFNESTVCFYDIWEANGQPGELAYEKLHTLTKQKEKCNEYEWAEYVLMDSAVKLIVNCLCYLNAVDTDINIRASNPNAEELLQELSKTKKSQAVNKLKDKLKKVSYSKIHFCGNDQRKHLNTQFPESELEPHWRRGHWRNQPFGNALSNSKLIWIKPTIVRKDKGTPEAGHIYDA
ncbi:MAG: hypothetical protein JST82_11355 [Bacteroidetes bacterium]|nr:hypothetical protein [Bacteroidota bacterium]